MLQVHAFPFNKFQENTYVVSDESGHCAIFDPGMSNSEEEALFLSYIRENKLTPVALYNTHCHVDHVLGNHFIFEQYGLIPQFHELEIPILVAVQNMAPAYGFRYEGSRIPETFLEENQVIAIGEHTLKILFVPGHSPGHLCFYSAEENFLIGRKQTSCRAIGCWAHEADF